MQEAERFVENQKEEAVILDGYDLKADINNGTKSSKYLFF